MQNPLVGVVMGSTSDWPVMEQCHETLKHFDIAHECRVVSAHRTPDLMFEYAQTAADRGLRAMIVQMPKGVPVATFAIGESGAINAALFAVAMIAADNPDLAAQLQKYRQVQSEAAKSSTLPAT